MMNKLMNKVKGFVETMTLATANTGIQSAKLLFGTTFNSIGTAAKFYDMKMLVPIPWEAIYNIDRYMRNTWENKWDVDDTYRIPDDTEIMCIERTNKKETFWISSNNYVRVRIAYTGIFVHVNLGMCKCNKKFECDYGNRSIFIPRNEIRLHSSQLFTYLNEHKRIELQEAKETIVSMHR